MSIGASLRDAREQSGLTLEQVSQATRIRRTILEAIERDDWAACGGDVYARGHIKSYARAVGLDGTELLASGGRSRPEPSEPEQPRAMAHPTTQVVSTPEPIPIRSMGQAFANEKKAATEVTRTGPNWSAVMAGALAVVVVLGIVGYVARGRGDSPAPSALPSTTSASPSTTAPSSSPTPTPKPSPTIVAVRPTSDVVTVTIKANGSSWVQANTGKGGSVLWEGTLTAGDTKTITNPKKVRLVVGNAGNVTLVVNGRSLGAPGADGQVAKVEFGPGDPTLASG